MTSVWVEKQRAYLELEREAERLQLTEKLSKLTSQECQEYGISLLSLDIESSCTSLFGRVKYKIIKKDQQPLPIHSFKVGDEAELYEYKRNSNAEYVSINGIISKVTSLYIEMVCDESDLIDLNSPLRLDMRSSEATQIKLVHALNDLEHLEDSPAWPVVDLLFGETPLQECIQRTLQPFNTNLNESQLNAVSYALCAPNLALIHGPPGTGKTTAVVELILQALSCGLKILVCAPSNVAVDNILERLVCAPSVQVGTSVKVTPRAVRLGHPARVSEAIQSHCLDALISTDEGTEIVGDVRKDIDDNRKALSKAKAKKDRGLQRELQAEIRNLRKEIRKREDRVVRNIMESRNVVLSTLVGASSRQLRGVQFDMVIIDEAAQALEVACWIPMLHASKVVLAGDHCQLPPTIKSTEAAKKGLGVTLFERIISLERLAPCAQLLDTQYRMNKDISEWSSHEMYHDRLKSHSSNSSHTLFDLISNPISATGTTESKTEMNSVPVPASVDEDLVGLSKTVMLLIDTAGCNMEEDGCRGGSYRNTAEAEIVVAHIYRLYKLGLRPEQIGVITPYNGQLELLRELVAAREGNGIGGNELGETLMSAKEQVEKSRLEIRTVDGFQGGEKEAIILSLVRSNENKEVGFLAESRRINVAVTRAKRHLVVVCDSDTCSKDAFIDRLLSHVSHKGEHRSALEYIQSIGVTLSSHSSMTDEYSAALMQTLPSLPPSKSDQPMPPNPPNGTTGNSKKSSNTSLSEKKLLSKQMKKLESKQKITTDKLTVAAAPLLDDPFSRHMGRLLLHLALGRLSGGVIGNGALRILSVDNKSSQDMEEELRFYSNLITPRPSSSSSSAALIFPASLNSHQRLTIHTIAEKINGMRGESDEEPKAQLTHESVGEGTERRIEVHAQIPSAEPSAEEGGKGQEENDDLSEEESPATAVAFPSNQFETIAMDEAADLMEMSSHPQSQDTHSENGTQSLPSQQKGKEPEKPKKQPQPKKPQQQPKKQKEDKVLSGIKAGKTEDELIEEAIRANSEHANYHKYRLKATPMPNPEKIKASASLRATISQSQLSRGGETRKSTMESNNSKSSGANSKKVVKKPPSAVRNFGGGRLGGG